MPKKEITSAEENTIVITAIETSEGTTIDIDSNKITAESIAMCIASLITVLYEEGIPMRSLKKRLKEYIKQSLEKRRKK